MIPYQKVIRGRDSLKRLPELAEKLNLHKPLIVGNERLAGKLMRKAPALLSCPVYSGYRPNPELADSEAGLEMFCREECDGLVAIGGGSAMDTAKAIKARMMAADGEELKANRYSLAAECPQIAVPGTAGTGAEATQFAVVYEDGRKLSLSHPALRPEGVVLDASLLDSLPDYHRKSCALDALAQGIESYWSRGATADSRVNAFLAALGVLDNLKGYLAGDPHAAEEMLDASYQSGKAIQVSRTTAAHAMSYRLTKTLGVAHGHACMLTLPVLWEMMQDREDMKEVLGSLSAALRLGDLRMGPKLLRGILYDLEMAIPPMPDGETLDMLAESVNPERMSNHPVILSREEIREAYRRALTPPGANERQACIDIWRYYGRE